MKIQFIFRHAVRLSIFAVFLSLSACTKTNVVEIPPPDFRQLLLETRIFSGSRCNPNAAVGSLDICRDPILTISEGASKSELTFTFRDKLEGQLSPIEHKFRVVLGEYFKDATFLTIPEQQNGTYTYVGSPLSTTDPNKRQGYYQAFDTKNARIDELQFAVTISGVKWLFVMKKS